MRRATSFPHIKSSPINCARITLVVPNMGVESGVQKVYYVFYWISTLAFLDLLRWGTTGDLLINPLVAHFFVRTLGVVHCAVTDWLVLFELVTAPQPRIVSRAITTMIFLLPRRRAPSDTTAPHVTILRSCSEQKEASAAGDPLREDRKGSLPQTG